MGAVVVMADLPVAAVLHGRTSGKWVAVEQQLPRGRLRLARHVQRLMITVDARGRAPTLLVLAEMRHELRCSRHPAA
jgi:hypothetical protein